MNKQTRCIFLQNMNNIGNFTSMVLQLRSSNDKPFVQMCKLQLPPCNTATPEFWCVEKVFGDVEILGKRRVTK